MIPNALATIVLLATHAQAPVTYQAWTVNGHDFNVGRAGGLEVWFNPVAGAKEFAADIFIVNGSKNAVAVSPERISATALRESANGKQILKLKTYEPKQYESMLKRRYRRQTSIQTSVTSTIESAGSGVALGQHNGSPMDQTERAGPRGAGTNGGGPSGPRDVPVPNDATWSALSDSLLKSYMVPSGQHYGGLVYFSYRPGVSYHISIPVGATTFEFDFSLSKADEAKPD